MLATRHTRYVFRNSTKWPASKKDLVSSVTVINPSPNDPDFKDTEMDALQQASHFYRGWIEGHDRRLLEMGLFGLPPDAFVAEKRRYDLAKAAIDIVEMERINLRWNAIHVELADIANCKVIDGDPAQREGELWDELERLEYEAGEIYFRRRNAI